MPVLITVIVLALLVVLVLASSVKIIPQSRAGIVERLGRYQRTLGPGLSIIVPFVDKVRYKIDLREQVVSFPPQPVITEDNLVVSIDTVIYFKVTDPVRATYEIANYIQAIEQLTMTTLRNVIGGMDLEGTLTSRQMINESLQSVLDEATGQWGIKVGRVELKGIDPPASIQDSMEKQMRADRDKRAAILTAEGVRQSAILTSEGEKQSAILQAEGQRESQILAAQAERESEILKAQGQAKAINTVFRAIHKGRATPELLSYQYLQMLPNIAQGDANKMWIVPSELGKALEGIGNVVGGFSGSQDSAGGVKPPTDEELAAAEEAEQEELQLPQRTEETDSATRSEVQAAIAAAEDAARGKLGSSENKEQQQQPQQPAESPSPPPDAAPPAEPPRETYGQHDPGTGYGQPPAPGAGYTQPSAPPPPAAPEQQPGGDHLGQGRPLPPQQPGNPWGQEPPAQ